MGRVIVKDITERQIKRKEEKETIKGILKDIFGKKVKIKDRGDYSTLEVKLGKMFRKKVIMHLSFIGDSIIVYDKKYDEQSIKFAEYYQSTTKRLTALTKDYSGINLNI